MPAWPGTVPSTPQRGSFDQTRSLPRIAQTQMESGPPVAMVIERSSTAEQKIEIWMTRAQFATFETFVRTDLTGGVQRFTMPIHKDGNPTPVTKTVMLTGSTPYMTKPIGTTHVAVTMNLFIFGY